MRPIIRIEYMSLSFPGHGNIPVCLLVQLELISVADRLDVGHYIGISIVQSLSSDMPWTAVVCGYSQTHLPTKLCHEIREVLISAAEIFRYRKTVPDEIHFRRCRHQLH